MTAHPYTRWEAMSMVTEPLPTTNRALAALDRVIESWRASSVDGPNDDEWTRAHNETLRNCVAELQALSDAEHKREDEALERLAVSLRLHQATYREPSAELCDWALRKTIEFARRNPWPHVGPPTTGEHEYLTFGYDSSGAAWVCIEGGTPGQWVRAPKGWFPGDSEVARAS